jgi:hypothetical protein
MPELLDQLEMGDSLAAQVVVRRLVAIDRVQAAAAGGAENLNQGDGKICSGDTSSHVLVLPVPLQGRFAQARSRRAACCYQLEKPMSTA